LQVPGVADVVNYGGLVREIHVQPDPARMAALSVTLNDVYSALSKSSGNATGGYVERGDEAFVIRSLGSFNSVDEIKQVRVGSTDGVPVTLAAVAEVAEGYEPRQGVVTRDQNEDTIEGIVLMRRGENPSVVLAALRARVAVLNERILPKGVKINPFYDRTDLVATTLHTDFHNLLEVEARVTRV